MSLGCRLVARWTVRASGGVGDRSAQSRCSFEAESRHGRYARMDMTVPVRKDQELELEIDSLAYGGNRGPRLDRFVLFVRRGLPGDRVRARVTKVKRSHAEALAVEVVDPGPKRVDAPCSHYPACGGCRFQDLAYEAQAVAKEDQVRQALMRIGGIA